jgi:tetratricopeptide (TPR) repeat protein
MPTKLSRFCNGVMEAAWLAAVIIIPVFFNIYSSRIFEPDKITILRSLALLTLGAWAVKLIEEGRIKWRDQPQNSSLIRYLWGYPLLAPVMAIVVVYIISTIFSVTPSISLLGSYQRLQGTYTTFSYLVIFGAIIANLRKRDQVNRLVTTIILASLPVSLYGLLQRYQIDPIPWGGNVSRRIASNMGNSIFVAAYLIMVFPLTIGKIVESFRAILKNNDNESTSTINTTTQVIRATIYVFIAALQLIAIYMSGSRGPALGWMAGTYFLALLLSLYWRKRWLTFTIVGVAVIGAAFLAVFNINNGPLQSLRTSPAIGRFGLLLDPESNSALVRQYIWEGTVKLVGIHKPIKLPDGGGDKFNFLRPLFGYGPEGMYVAYNQFYPPALGQVEKRNASPDRSHNETWDSIVITGFSGLVVYLFVFGSVFYYGLRWQELVRSIRQRNVFFACLIGGGLIGAVGLIIWKGVEFLGVGLPFGMILGVVLYLTAYALFAPPTINENNNKNPYALLLIVLYAAIVGHFVEINFGIAIVATRTLFWTYAGLMLVIGYIIPKIKQEEENVISGETTGEMGSYRIERKRDKQGSFKHRRKVERSQAPLINNQPAWFRKSIISAILVGIILTTLGFDFVTNSGQPQAKSVITIIINSMTRLPNKENAFSLGVTALVMVTWLACILLFTAENQSIENSRSWWRALGVTALISLGIILLFWLLHAISLASLASNSPTNQNELILKINSIGSLLTKFYLYIFLILVFAAVILPEEWPSRGLATSSIGVIIAPIALILVFVLTNISNLHVIQADITFKMAEPFTKSSQWEVATFIYKRALELAPREDHYYLFLGRSYLEQAKVTENSTDQENLVLQAEKDLQVAQKINPLNTDHTANLARLYSWWAGKTTDTSTRTERGQIASDYYATAVTLSPNNSTLWDEWAILLMQILRQPQDALQRLQHAMELDDRFSLTQGLLGDYYMSVARSTSDASVKAQALEQAAGYYQTAANVATSRDTTSKGSYLVSLGNAYIEMARVDPQNINQDRIHQAIDILQQSIDAGLSTSDLWKVQEAIAKLYLQLGDKTNASFYANEALTSAPDSAISRIQNLITQTQSLP